MQKVDILATENPGQLYNKNEVFSILNNELLFLLNLISCSNYFTNFITHQVGDILASKDPFKWLVQQFYWPSIRKSIYNYVLSCDTCHKAKSDTLTLAGLLQPLPVPNQIWENITIDFIEGLPISHGKSTILVVVDRLSKSSHFAALNHPFTAKIIAEIFVNTIVKLHGMSWSIVRDCDPVFISHFWREFFKMSSTTLKMSSFYHPQTDGQSEVTNQILEQYLWCLCHQQPHSLSTLLHWAYY